MTDKTRFYITIIIGFFAIQTSRAQIFPSLAISGGPIAGWSFNKTDDLNKELTNSGFPEVSKNGFFTLGGDGFIDLPLRKNFIRIGGIGIGFSTNISKTVNDTLTKAVSYDFGLGGLSVEFVKPIKNFDITVGALFSTGTLKLNLYQYGNDYGNYNTIIGELMNNSASGSITRNFKVRFYSIQPQIGFGFLLYKFIYLRLNAGYLFSTQGTWKVDNNIDVTNFPSGIKADGFNISFGINVGLFFRD